MTGAARSKTMTLKKTKVEIDGVFKNLEAYVESKGWNGFSRPWFTKEEADKIVEQSNANDLAGLTEEAGVGKMRYDEAEDAYLAESAGQTMAYAGKDVTVNGETLRLYPVGNCGWTWTEPGVRVRLTERQALYAGYVLDNLRKTFTGDDGKCDVALPTIDGRWIVFADDDQLQAFTEDVEHEASYDASCGMGGTKTAGEGLALKLRREMNWAAR